MNWSKITIANKTTTLNPLATRLRKPKTQDSPPYNLIGAKVHFFS